MLKVNIGFSILSNCLLFYALYKTQPITIYKETSPYMHSVRFPFFADEVLTHSYFKNADGTVTEITTWGDGDDEFVTEACMSDCKVEEIRIGKSNVKIMREGSDGKIASIMAIPLSEKSYDRAYAFQIDLFDKEGGNPVEFPDSISDYRLEQIESW